jgi:hypothetical protein
MRDTLIKSGCNYDLGGYYYGEVKKFKDKKVAENAIIMLGNSITAGGKWKEYFPTENIENFGIIGDDSYGVFNRLDAVIAKKPSKIFLKYAFVSWSAGVSISIFTIFVIKKITRRYSVYLVGC